MILQADKLTLQYGQKIIADKLNFKVDKSEIISIIGPNGSGKSTLLKSLGRLLKPTHGTVLLEGKDIQKMKPGDIARKMSILPQSSTAPMDMTVYDLVCYGRMPHQGLFSSPNKIDEEKIEEALTQTNTSHMRYRRLDTLSGGERQRAWLAMAIAQNPEILLLDEPTTYLDVKHQLDLMNLVYYWCTVFPLFIEKGNAKEMILQADKLTLQYGQKIIADKLNFKVDKSEIISIIGPNGSGKSTLLKSLGRLLKPTHGTVLLEGKDIQKMKPGDIARKMSILPQSSTAPMDMTVYDLVCYGRMPHQGLFSSPNKIDEEKIEEALTQTNTSHMRYRRLDTLSGGERQRAWLAMAIAQNPEILLLDEPTTYLDVKHQLDLMNLVYKLYETRKITVIMVLHDLNHAARYSHRLVAVKKGKIFAEGLVQDVFTEKILCDLYDVETSVMSLEQNGQKHLVCFPYDVKQGEKN